MNNVKKIGISLLIGILVGGSAVGFITQRRALASYSELESRYSIIEKSNLKLREENQKLVDNNIRNGELITEGRRVLNEFNGELANSNSTIERIEKGIGALESLIELLLPTIED